MLSLPRLPGKASCPDWFFLEGLGNNFITNRMKSGEPVPHLEQNPGLHDQVSFGLGLLC
jgi:hypothetical protein